MKKWITQQIQLTHDRSDHLTVIANNNHQRIG